MNTLKKLWKFLLFILPNVQSKLKDLREILDMVDDGMRLIEERRGIPLTDQRRSLKQLKDTL